MPVLVARASPIPESIPAPISRARPGIALSLAACVLFAAVLAFSGLGARALISPAEARYAEVAREMVESGDWIQPHFNHVRYYEKPPLTYWTVALSYRLFGYTEFASRLPSALAYVGTVAVTFLLALELLGAGTAPFAALIYATSLGPFLFGRFLFTDTLLVFWLSAALYGLARIARRPDSAIGPAILYLGASLAGLTKGLIGLFFPFAAAVGYAIIAGGRPFVRRLRPALGVAIVAAVFLPWHVLLARRDPAFLSFYFVHEQLARFVGRRDPINYTPLSIPAFWIATLLWLFPWCLFLPSALPRRGRERRLALPWIWALGILLFFTVTGARLEYYALPALPALAVILGAAWRRRLTTGRRAAAIRAPSLVIAALGLAAAPLIFLSTRSGTAVLTRLVANLDGYYREYFAARPGASMIFGAELLRRARPFPIVLVVVGAATFFVLARGRVRPAFAIWALGIVPVLGLADAGMRLVAADRSQRAAAEIVEENWTPNARIVVVGDYEEGCGITFYTGKSTEVVGGPGSELLFGFRRGDAPDVFVTPEAFLKEWDSPGHTFVLGSRDLALPGARILLDGPRFRLLARGECPPSRADALATRNVAARSEKPFAASAHVIR